MASSNDLRTKAASIIGGGSLTVEKLREIAQKHDVRILDDARKRDINEEIMARLMKKNKSPKGLAKDIVDAHEELKKRRKELRGSRGKQQKEEPQNVREVFSTLNRIMNDEAAGRKRAVIADEDVLVDEEEERQVEPEPEPKVEKKKKKTPKSKKSAVLEEKASVDSSFVTHDEITGFLLAMPTNVQHIVREDGGSFPRLTKTYSNWIKLPQNLVMFQTKIDLPEPLASDSTSVDNSGVAFVLRPEALAFGDSEKLPCYGSVIVQKSVLNLIDLTSPTSVAKAIKQTFRSLQFAVKNKNHEKLVNVGGIKFPIGSEIAALARFKRTIDRMAIMLDAPQLIHSPMMDMFVYSVAPFISKMLYDEQLDGAVVRMHMGSKRIPLDVVVLNGDTADQGAIVSPPAANVFARCESAKQWMQNYTENVNVASRKMAAPWQSINMCPNGICLQAHNIKLTNGVQIPVVTLPSLVPLYTMELADLKSFKGNSGAVPLWFSPKSLGDFAEEIRKIVIDRETRRLSIESAKHKNNRFQQSALDLSRGEATDLPSTESEDLKKATSAKLKLITYATKSPITLLDLRTPIGSDALHPEVVKKFRERIAFILSHLGGHVNKAMAAWLDDRLFVATQTISNHENFEFIKSLVAQSLVALLPKGKTPPSGWVTTVKDPLKPNSYHHVAYLLDGETATWQVRNWISEQNNFFEQRVADAVAKYQLGNTGMQGLHAQATDFDRSLGKLSSDTVSRALMDNPQAYDKFIDVVRMMAVNPKYLSAYWNGPLATHPSVQEESIFKLSVDMSSWVKSTQPSKLTFALVPAGVFMRIAVFGADQSAVEAKALECKSTGVVGRYIRGASGLKHVAKKGFNWAWSKTKTSMTFIDLSNRKQFETVFSQLIGDIEHQSLREEMRVLFTKVAEQLEPLQVPKSADRFNDNAYAILTQGNIGASQMLDKDSECAANIRNEAAARQARPGAIAANASQSNYGKIEQLISALIKYYGLDIDGWYVSAGSIGLPSASAVVFGVVGDRSEKFFHLGSNAPAGGGPLTWHIVANDEDAASSSRSFLVPISVRKRAEKLVVGDSQ